MRLAIASAVVVILAGCGGIDRHRTVVQETGEALVAGVGDALVTVRKQRDLENAVGGADIFGRKTDEGTSELRFAGMAGPSTVLLVRHDVAVQSNETTMNRGGLYRPGGSSTTTTGTVGSTPFTMNSRTQQAGTFVPAPRADSVVLPPTAMQVELDLRTTRSLVFEGQKVEILEASSSGISYRIAP